MRHKNRASGSVGGKTLSKEKENNSQIDEALNSLIDEFLFKVKVGDQSRKKMIDEFSKSILNNCYALQKIPLRFRDVPACDYFGWRTGTVEITEKELCDGSNNRNLKVFLDTPLPVELPLKNSKFGAAYSDRVLRSTKTTNKPVKRLSTKIRKAYKSSSKIRKVRTNSSSCEDDADVSCEGTSTLAGHGTNGKQVDSGYTEIQKPSECISQVVMSKETIPSIFTVATPTVIFPNKTVIITRDTCIDDVKLDPQTLEDLELLRKKISLILEAHDHC